MIKSKLKIGQQVRTHMLGHWGMGTIVALGLKFILISYKTPLGYYEDTVFYNTIKDYNKHLFKEN